MQYTKVPIECFVKLVPAALKATTTNKNITLCDAIMLRGHKIGLPGWISAGFQSGKSKNRLSSRPEAVRRADVEAFPTSIRPKSAP